MTASDLINRVLGGESITEVIDEITTTSAIPAKPPRPLGLFRNRKRKGKLPFIGWREPQNSPEPTSHRSYEGVDEASRTKPASYTGGYAGVGGALATQTKTAPSFSRQDPEGSPWKRAIRRKRYRGYNIGFGKSDAMKESLSACKHFSTRNDGVCVAGCKKIDIPRGNRCPWGADRENDWETARKSCPCYEEK